MPAVAAIAVTTSTGNLGEFGVFFLAHAEFPSIHHRHQQVEDDEIGAGARGLEKFERLEAVLRALDLVTLVFEDVAERFHRAPVVIDNQNCALVMAVGHYPDRRRRPCRL